MINIESYHVSLPNETFTLGKKLNDSAMKNIIHDRPYMKKQPAYLLNYHELVKIMLKKKERLKTGQILEVDQISTNCRHSNHRNQYSVKSCHERLSQTQKKTPQSLLKSQNLRQTSSRIKVQKYLSKTKWKEGILRRKNNGSQGKIITGLTSFNISNNLRKVQKQEAMVTSIDNIQFAEITPRDFQDFQPIGVANQINMSDYSNNKGKSSVLVHNKTKIRKKMTFEGYHREKNYNYQSIRTEPDEICRRKSQLTKSTQHKRKTPETEQKSLYQTQRLQKPLSPWHDSPGV